MSGGNMYTTMKEHVTELSTEYELKYQHTVYQLHIWQHKVGPNVGAECVFRTAMQSLCVWQ